MPNYSVLKNKSINVLTFIFLVKYKRLNISLNQTNHICKRSLVWHSAQLCFLFTYNYRTYTCLKSPIPLAEPVHCSYIHWAILGSILFKGRCWTPIFIYLALKDCQNHCFAFQWLSVYSIMNLTNSVLRIWFILQRENHTLYHFSVPAPPIRGRLGPLSGASAALSSILELEQCSAGQNIHSFSAAYS